MTVWSAALISAVMTLSAGASDPGTVYCVRPGDTLSAIAKAHLGDGNRWPEIARLNGLKPPYGIRVGQRLHLPRTAAPRTEAPSPDAPVGASGDREATLSVPEAALLWAIVSLAAFWLFSSVCLKGGCWFSLVEASFGRCSVLCLLLAGTLVLCLGLAGAAGYLALKETVPLLTVPIAAIVLSLAYIVLSAALTKRLLGCKWRSVMTVFVMANLVGHLVGGVAFLAVLFFFPVAMDTLAAREFLDALLKSF